LECGSLLPLFPLGGTSLLAGIAPQAEMTASKLAEGQSGGAPLHSKATS